MYRGAELRRYQFFTVADWPGGLYCSPSFAGSRPGALSAACWAALVSMGESGYLEAVRKICDTATTIKTMVRDISPLCVVGDPLFVVGIQSTSDAVDIYRVFDAMTERGWSLNGLHTPPGIHLCVTLRHTAPGVAERFASDLRAATDDARREPQKPGGMAPLYGMANALPNTGVVDTAMAEHMDGWFRVE
jgi:glutamate/tyrosine decarboxylase-like PLP-dependent enzyme